MPGAWSSRATSVVRDSARPYPPPDCSMRARCPTSWWERTAHRRADLGAAYVLYGEAGDPADVNIDQIGTLGVTARGLGLFATIPERWDGAAGHGCRRHRGRLALRHRDRHGVLRGQPRAGPTSSTARTSRTQGTQAQATSSSRTFQPRDPRTRGGTSSPVSRAPGWALPSAQRAISMLTAAPI